MEESLFAPDKSVWQHFVCELTFSRVDFIQDVVHCSMGIQHYQKSVDFSELLKK